MSAAEVAKIGYEAMMKGDLEVVAGFANKFRAAMSHIAGFCTGSNASRHG